MPTPKSDLRAAAEQRVAGARARLDAVLATTDDGGPMAEALARNDGVAALAEAQRLAPAHPEVGEAWKGLDEAIKMLAFSLLTDMGNGTD